MIRAIIFDCFGVLTKDWWREFCATLPEGEVRDKASELNSQYDAGLLNLKDFVRQVHEVTGREPQPVEDMLASPEPMKNKELLDYISELKTDYKIGMISNVGTNWIRDYFLTGEEQKLFDDMILSFETGMTKPNPEIYKLSAKHLRVEPNECIFIDDVDRYAVAAESVGMRGIVYENFRQLKTDLEKLLAANADK